MDGPVFASGKSKFRCGRVQPCVRPRPAAHMWPRALMKSADWIPITSMRTKRLARKGCPNPRFDRCAINTQSSCKPLRDRIASGVDADRAKAPSVAAHCGFLVEDAEAAFLAGAILPELTVDFGGRRSSAVGGAPSQRMIASKPGRSCFFSSAVSWASIPRA